MQQQHTRELVITLDIGGTNSRAEVLRWNGTAFEGPLYTGHVATPAAHTTDNQGDQVFAAIVALVRDVLAQLTDSERQSLAAVGVGVPGVVDCSTGYVHLAANLGWHERAVGAELTAALGLPVLMCNDVVAAGVAEQEFGAGRGSDNVLSVFLGTGIAATVTVAGELVQGGVMADGFRQPAGEIGHMPVELDGLECACGQHGCWEMYASARSFGRLYSEALGVDPLGPSAKSARQLAEAAAESEPVAVDVWARATRYLAHGLLAASTVFGPTRIVLGGGLSHAGAQLVDSVTSHFADMSRVLRTPEIVVAELGGRAGVLGVALLSMRRAGGVALQ